MKAQLSVTRTRLRDAKPESMDVSEAQRLFREVAEVFPDCTEDEKERLVDTVLRRAVVDKDKAVEFEFYAGDGMKDVVQYVKVGSPALVIGQHRNCRTISITASGQRVN